MGTFLPNLDTLGLWVLELFAMYATDERTDKSNAYCPFSYGGLISVFIHMRADKYNITLYKKQVGLHNTKRNKIKLK